ncbi:MAG: DNA translocase FtsK 4TM domain-containing protein [Gammaproteobacteria bacterium]|nr:DNA translocase FtsK 4TM domain-containing protein [Gammaproteobacteria bacterium]
MRRRATPPGRDPRRFEAPAACCYDARQPPFPGGHRVVFVAIFQVSKAARLDGDSAPMKSAVNALRESALWVLGALALIMLVALVSYDPRDPGFSQTGDGLPVRNQIGSGGAWFADISFSLFGGPAYLLPAMMALAGWLVFSMRRLPGPLDRTLLGTRLGGFVLTLLSSCGLGTLHFAAGSLPQSAGGALGELVGTGLAGSLGSVGATLLLLALWLAGVSLFTGLSWLALMDGIGRHILDGIERLRHFSQQARERADIKQAQEQRQESVRAERRKVEKKAPPRIEPVVKPPETGSRVEQERQVKLFEQLAPGELPPLSLLDDPPQQAPGYSTEGLQAMSRLVEMKLRDFGVEVEVVSVHPGPVVTRFELNPAPGVKVSQISSLAKDLARSLSAVSVRVVEVIPGKSTVGLEIPNETRELVTLGEILRSRAYEDMHSPLTLALGKDIAGKSVVADLQRMPHLLIAGTTGSGKSVGINAMVLSLIYKARPEEVRLIMVDPKMLELSVYEGIPHLLCPVVTDMKDAANALRWCVVEMDRRYRLMAALGVRNIAGYNRKIRAAQEKGESIPDPFPPNTADGIPAEPEPLQPLPFIVVIIDELADMMMIVGKKVEELIARLAQKARASGIHMIVATQRPSVDVITGLIKANIPCRIAFQVSAKVDSRTILDQSGAEHLLGHGDMLFMAPGTAAPLRVHGAFVSDQEVHRVTTQLKGVAGPQYLDEVLEGPSTPIPGISGEPAGGENGDGEADPLYDQAVQVVVETRRASVSGVQRRLKIGYNRAARLVETMEQAGLVGPLQSNGSREVLAPPPPEA